jgi:hypothetical protein
MMSSKLDDLRRRVLQNPPPEGIAEPPVEAVVSFKTRDSDTSNAEPKDIEPRVIKAAERAPANADTETSKREEAATAVRAQARQGTPSVKGDADRRQLSDAVAKVFEDTKSFEVRLYELRRILDQIEKDGGSADELFAPLRSLHVQLSQLAQSLGPMRAVQAQLAQLAETFEPIKALHDQLAEVGNSFQDHLAQLVRALDLAKNFRDRILRLAHTFDQAEGLQAEFSELYSAIRAARG